MKLHSSIFASLLIVSSIGACNNDGTTTQGDTNVPPQANQTLVVTGDCEFAACGVVPSSMSTEAAVTCEPASATACVWSPSSADGSVSYRFCSETECPAKPTVACPDGTTFASQTCGSENDGPCTWSTTCKPPRITTPCPNATGCDSLPQLGIGVICSDGTTGGFACVTNGTACYWERDCD